MALFMRTLGGTPMLIAVTLALVTLATAEYTTSWGSFAGSFGNAGNRNWRSAHIAGPFKRSAKVGPLALAGYDLWIHGRQVRFWIRTPNFWNRAWQTNSLPGRAVQASASSVTRNAYEPRWCLISVRFHLPSTLPPSCVHSGGSCPTDCCPSPSP